MLIRLGRCRILLPRGLPQHSRHYRECHAEQHYGRHERPTDRLRRPRLHLRRQTRPPTDAYLGQCRVLHLLDRRHGGLFAGCKHREQGCKRGDSGYGVYLPDLFLLWLDASASVVSGGVLSFEMRAKGMAFSNLFVAEGTLPLSQSPGMTRLIFILLRWYGKPVRVPRCVAKNCLEDVYCLLLLVRRPDNHYLLLHSRDEEPHSTFSYSSLLSVSLGEKV